MVDLSVLVLEIEDSISSGEFNKTFEINDEEIKVALDLGTGSGINTQVMAFNRWNSPDIDHNNRLLALSYLAALLEPVRQEILDTLDYYAAPPA